MSDIISVEGQGRDEYGARYFQIDATNVDLVISAKTIVSEPSRLFEVLTNAGTNCITAKAKKAVLDEVESFCSDTYDFRVATKVGFFHNQFILPAQTIGMSSPPTYVVLDDLDQALLQKYRSNGALKQWQTKVANLAVGNSRLMFALALALTGPILPFVQGPRTGGFQLVGPPENGKTTATMVAGSVWGCHVSRERQDKGFIESWHTTEGQVEKTALAHNNTVLLLDETRLAGNNANSRANTLNKSVFQLSEGTERNRMTNTGPVRGSQFYFFSTSNLSFHEIAAAGKVEMDDAYLSRMFDIPCPVGTEHGIYETIHDFVSGEEMSDALQRRSCTYFGTAGLAFVWALVAARNHNAKALRGRIERYRDQYRKKAKAALASEGLKSSSRVAGRCATTYAAGRLAIDYGVLPWQPADLGRAILTCHVAGLRLHTAQASQGEPSEAELRRQLIAYLAAGRGFVDLRDGRPAKGSTAAEAPAFVGEGKEAGWFYLRKTAVVDVIGTDGTAKELLRRLQADGLMKRNNDGFVVQRRIYSGGTGNQNFAWVYAFNPALIKSA